MVSESSNQQTLPLHSWGVFRGRRRLSESPYIESIWTGMATRNGVHLTAADGAIDLTFQARQSITRLILSGPTSRAQPTAYEAGDEVLTIRLRAGVHLPFIASTKLADVDQYVAGTGKRHFWLYGTSVAFPDFNNIEIFVERLVRAGLLQRDILVEDMLIGRSRPISLRTIQRHFLASTGLTMSQIRQIRRAEQARSLLAGSYTLASIAYEAGYSNPGHMTNAFTYFFGQTPSSMRRLMVGEAR